MSARQALSIIRKSAVLFIGLALAVFCLNHFELKAFLKETWLDAHIRNQGLRGIALYLALSSVFSAIGLPRQLLAFGAGYAFGAELGLLWVNIGVSLGALLDFCYARFLGRKLMTRWFGDKLRKLDSFLSRSPCAMVFVLRCLPVGHNATLNLLSGVSGIKLRHFLAGSFLGYIPQHLVFTILGSGIHIELIWRISLSAFLFVLSGIFGYKLYRKYAQ